MPSPDPVDAPEVTPEPIDAKWCRFEKGSLECINDPCLNPHHGRAMIHGADLAKSTSERTGGQEYGGQEDGQADP